MPTPIVDETGAAMEGYIQGFLQTFRGSRLEYRGDYDPGDSQSRKAYVAVQELLKDEKRVVGRKELEEKIVELYGEDQRPSNIDQQVLPSLEKYGITLPVSRFKNVGYDWYFLDQELLEWLEEIDRNHSDPNPPSARIQTMTTYLENGVVNDQPISGLVAWFAGICAEHADFVGYDASIEMIDPKTEDVPDGYLLSEYLRTGEREHRFKEYLIHAELVGDFDFNSRRLFDRKLRQQFELLQVAAAFGDHGNAATRLEELRLEMTEREGGFTADAWQQQLGTDAACFTLDTAISDGRTVVSCYRGRWD